MIPNPFLEQLERVIERIQRVETSQLGVSEKEDPESFPRTTREGYEKDTMARLKVSEKTRTFKIDSANPFLRQLEKVMESASRQETPRSGVYRCYEHGYLNSEIRKSKGKDSKSVISFQ
jgi:hypothetical protein